MVLVSHGFFVYGFHVMNPLKGLGKLHCNGLRDVSGEESLSWLGRVLENDINRILFVGFPLIGVFQDKQYVYEMLRVVLFFLLVDLYLSINFNMLLNLKVYIWLGYLNLMNISNPNVGFRGMNL